MSGKRCDGGGDGVNAQPLAPAAMWDKKDPWLAPAHLARMKANCFELESLTIGGSLGYSVG